MSTIDNAAPARSAPAQTLLSLRLGAADAATLARAIVAIEDALEALDNVSYTYTTDGRRNMRGACRPGIRLPLSP